MYIKLLITTHKFAYLEFSVCNDVRSRSFNSLTACIFLKGWKMAFSSPLSNQRASLFKILTSLRSMWWPGNSMWICRETTDKAEWVCAQNQALTTVYRRAPLKSPLPPKNRQFCHQMTTAIFGITLSGHLNKNTTFSFFNFVFEILWLGLYHNQVHRLVAWEWWWRTTNFEKIRLYQVWFPFCDSWCWFLFAPFWNNQ